MINMAVVYLHTHMRLAYFYNLIAFNSPFVYCLNGHLHRSCVTQYICQKGYKL